MPQTSTRLKLPYIQPSQAQKHVTHNEALLRLDAVVQAGIVEFDADTPPLGATDGLLYALGMSPSGAWAGKSGHLAMQVDGGWIFIEPQQGWRAWDNVNGRIVVFDAGGWRPAIGELSQIDGLGIGMNWDTVNRIAVEAEASLFTHDGADHRLKINKAQSSDSASVIFQTAWAGHAEMGLVGNDEFAIKVSPDGVSWTEALKFDSTGSAVSGSVVQQSPTDTSPGRLMRADWGYGPASILGSVSMNGAQPSGAVIETGSNTNGAYVRWADGTQMCWHTFNLSYEFGTRMRGTWTFPVTYNAIPIVTPPSLNSAFQGTPHPRELGLFTAVASTGSATVDLWRSDGGSTNFDPADVYTVRALAVGRWF